MLEYGWAREHKAGLMDEQLVKGIVGMLKCLDLILKRVKGPKA